MTKGIRALVGTFNQFEFNPTFVYLHINIPCCALNITFFYPACMTCTFALQLVKGIDLNLVLILFVYTLIFIPFRVLGTFNQFEFSPTFVYL